MARLTGKVALITGAAGEQESAEAELFAREGAALVLTDIDAAAGEACAVLPRRKSSDTKIEAPQPPAGSSPFFSQPLHQRITIRTRASRH